MSHYAIGLDFGTESARGLLVDLETGKEVATEVFTYPHGVIDEALPEGNVHLEPDWALQHPADYLEALRVLPPAILKIAGARPDDVIGIGMDFTSCTILPTDKNGAPLCLKDQFKANPHAWVKLWKHHSAQPEADRVTEVAAERNEPFLARYGGKISSEWFFPKTLEILNDAPEIYDVAARILEGGDWITLKLTGRDIRNATAAGYKALWEKRTGFPSREFFKAVHPRLENVIEEKMSADIRAPSSRAGELTEEMAALMGLPPGIAVGVPSIDAHAAVAGAGIVTPGRMLLVLGTSFCHMVLGDELHLVEGLCGVVEDGIIPGFYGYEAGQAGGGDMYAWLMENAVPPAYHEEARQAGTDIYSLMEKKAAALRPGESGLVILDWWNGVRLLGDSDLTGLVLGYNLTTGPEDIYRAMIEATAFGTRKIIERLRGGGIPIDEVVACGGLANRNKLLMQIFADVLKTKMTVAGSEQATALGAAIYGAVAAGKNAGGFDSIADAAGKLTALREEKYEPIEANARIYDELYREYEILFDHFGTGGNDVMKTLKAIRSQATRT